MANGTSPISLSRKQTNNDHGESESKDDRFFGSVTSADAVMIVPSSNSYRAVPSEKESSPLTSSNLTPDKRGKQPGAPMLLIEIMKEAPSNPEDCGRRRPGRPRGSRDKKQRAKRNTKMKEKKAPKRKWNAITMTMKLTSHEDESGHRKTGRPRNVGETTNEYMKSITRNKMQDHGKTMEDDIAVNSNAFGLVEKKCKYGRHDFPEAGRCPAKGCEAVNSRDSLGPHGNNTSCANNGIPSLSKHHPPNRAIRRHGEGEKSVGGDYARGPRMYHEHRLHQAQGKAPTRGGTVELREPSQFRGHDQRCGGNHNTSKITRRKYEEKEEASLLDSSDQVQLVDQVITSSITTQPRQPAPSSKTTHQGQTSTIGMAFLESRHFSVPVGHTQEDLKETNRPLILSTNDRHHDLPSTMAPHNNLIDYGRVGAMTNSPHPPTMKAPVGLYPCRHFSQRAPGDGSKSKNNPVINENVEKLHSSYHSSPAEKETFLLKGETKEFYRGGPSGIIADAEESSCNNDPSTCRPVRGGGDKVEVVSMQQSPSTPMGIQGLSLPVGSMTTKHTSTVGNTVDQDHQNGSCQQLSSFSNDIGGLLQTTGTQEQEDKGMQWKPGFNFLSKESKPKSRFDAVSSVEWCSLLQRVPPGFRHLFKTTSSTGTTEMPSAAFLHCGDGHGLSPS